MATGPELTVNFAIFNQALRELRFLIFQKDALPNGTAHVYAWNSRLLAPGDSSWDISLPLEIQVAGRLGNPGDMTSTNLEPVLPGQHWTIEGAAGDAISIKKEEPPGVGFPDQITIVNRSELRVEAALLKDDRPLVGKDLAVGDYVHFQLASSLWVAATEESKGLQRGDVLPADELELPWLLAIPYGEGVSVYTVTAEETGSGGAINLTVEAAPQMPFRA